MFFLIFGGGGPYQFISTIDIKDFRHKLTR